MTYELVQYGCNECGVLSEVVEADSAQFPEGWITISKSTHYCDKCASKHKLEEYGLQ